MKKKKLLSILLACTLAFPVFSLALPADAATVKNNTRYDLWMKVGTERYYNRNEVATSAGVPFIEDGVGYLPADAVGAYLSQTATVNGTTVTVGDKEFTAENGARVTENVGYLPIDGVATAFSLLFYVDEAMGLLALSDNALNYDETYDSIQNRMVIANNFAFDYPTTDQIIDDVANGIGLTTHPRLLVTADKFAELRDLYNNKDPDVAYATQKKNITTFVNKGVSSFNKFFKMDGSTVVFKDKATQESLRQPYFCYDENGNAILPQQSGDVYQRFSINPDYNTGNRSYVKDGNYMVYTLKDDNGKVIYTSKAQWGDGYDEGGRSSCNSNTAHVQNLGFAYQITGEKKYAEAAYLIMMELGKWQHWGEGHFLNCADATAGAAVGFDWVYNAFEKDEPEKNAAMAKVIFDLGVVKGYWSSVRFGKHDRSIMFPHMFISSSRTSNWNFDNCTNNWNSVCTSGMVIGGLSILEYPEYRRMSAGMISSLMETLPECYHVYTPDGCYMEGAGYWAYGTNTIFLMCEALETSVGSDYGCMDGCGLDKTGYFIYYIGNGNTTYWGFHDNGASKADLSHFYYLSKRFGNSDFAFLRNGTLEAGVSSLGWGDVLFFDPSLAEGGTEPVLDYNMKGLYTATMRSDWGTMESGTIFTGLHAGPSSASHGDMDTGNFMLEAGGVRWFGDLGNDNYLLNRYFHDDARYWYYRKTPEAHSILLVMPKTAAKSDEMVYGQRFLTESQMKDGHITHFLSNEYGAVAVAAMTEFYGSDCTSATRALMLTASRSTVVVQDEVEFKTPTSIKWLGMLANNATAVTVTNRGKTAYLERDNKILRLTLQSSNPFLQFTFKEGGSDPILPTTVSINSPANKDASGNTINGYASDTMKTLMIEANDVTSLQMAVVMELVSSKETKDEVRYTRVPTADMVPEKYEKPDPGENPGEDGPFVDHSDVLPADLLAAVGDMPEYSKENALAFAEAVQHLYVLEAALNPENPDTGAARRAMKDYLSDIEDDIDELNETLLKIERVRKKASVIPLGI